MGYSVILFFPFIFLSNENSFDGFMSGHKGLEQYFVNFFSFLKRKVGRQIECKYCEAIV